MFLSRSYKTYLTEWVLNTSTWEVEFKLNSETNSEQWYLLIAPWTDNEESFYGVFGRSFSISKSSAQ